MRGLLSTPEARSSSVTRALSGALLIAIAACSPPAPEPVTPQRVAELEAAAARTPVDVDARVQLAAAYLQGGHNQEAATLLEGVVDSPSRPAAASYLLGVAYEALNRSADARRRYGEYLQRGASDELKRRVRGRLAVLDRRDLETAVRAALAREQELATSTPAPRVVGVFPFLSGAGEELSPLGRAMAELLTTDLGQTDRLTVVERAQVQFLLDEIRLAEEGVVDVGTAARAGRLLGAGRIVQGRLDGSEAALRIQALVVPVGGARDPAAAPLTQQGALRDLFTMQATLALSLYRSLGVELTVAERERVLRQPTRNVQALLAFGFGLEAEDARRYPQAIEQYERAIALDGTFEDARIALERARALADAQDDTTGELAEDSSLELAPDFAQWVRRRARFAGVDGLVPDPGTRDAGSEILGTEGFDRRAVIDLLIRRPGGN